MQEFTYTVFVTVAAVAATMVAIFTSGIAAVLWSAGGTTDQHATHVGRIPLDRAA